jgi:hypothetical protein
MAIATTISAQFKAIDKVTAPMKKMTRSVGMFSSKTNANLTRVNMKLLAVRKRVQGVGRSMTKWLGKVGIFAGLTAMTMVLGNVVKTFADFEQANVVTASVMGKTIEQTKALQSDALRLGATTAKTATEVVGLQESYARLGFTQQQIINMTESTIAGSIAMRSELSDTADLVGAVVNTFDSFSSINAPEIMDQMTMATQKSALNFEKLQTALPNVAGAANAAGIPFNKLLALLGKLSDAGIDASSSSTALRNIFLQSAKQGKSYDQILGEIVKNQDKLTVSMDEFGVRGAVPATILSGKLNETLTLSAKILNSTGAASKTAARQLDTLHGATTLLGSAWQGFILNTEKGDGAMATFLKTTVQTVTEVLNLASGSAKATDKLTAQEKVIRGLATQFIGWLKVIKWVAIAYGALILAQKTFAAILAINKMVRFVRLIIMLGKAQKLATIAQWAFNAAAAINPYVLIAAAIIALIGAIVWLVKNWDTVKAATIAFYEKIKASPFGKFIASIKVVGLLIFKSLISPIRDLFALLAKIPRIGKIFDNPLEKMNGMINGIDTNVSQTVNQDTNRTEVISPAKVEENRNKNSAKQFGMLNLNIANRSNQDVDSFMFGDIKLQTTGN